MRNAGLPGSLLSLFAPASVSARVRPLINNTDTNRFGMSVAAIWTETVCCVDVS